MSIMTLAQPTDVLITKINKNDSYYSVARNKKIKGFGGLKVRISGELYLHDDGTVGIEAEMLEDYSSIHSKIGFEKNQVRSFYSVTITGVGRH